MRPHTSTFKTKIGQLGRQIKSKVIYYKSYNIIAESTDNILSENDLQLITENVNFDDYVEIDEEDIYSIEVIKNGNLLQSLMKQVNFEAKIDLNLGTVINPHFGVLINEENQTYEYLDYGNYWIYSKEYNVDMETWSYVCYDKMLYSMIKYKPMQNVEYPITLKNYVKILCNKAGIEFEESNFVNYSQLIYKDVYADRNVTIRDIFDEISKIVAGNLLINDDDKLEVGYPLDTEEIIDENYLRDINVKVNEKIGVINSIAIYDSDSKFQYLSEDSSSIKFNGMTRITITDNLLALNGDTQTIADNILTQLNDFYYYKNDFTTTGLCYFDFLDLFEIDAREETYQCILLNNEITISQGIEENIFTEDLEMAETSSNEYTTTVMTNKEVSFRIDTQEGKIESKVEKDGVISAINQSAEEIQIQAKKIKLEGYTTINNGFSIDEEGNMIANNGTFNGNINGGSIHIQKTADFEGTSVLQIDTVLNDESMTGSTYINGDEWRMLSKTGNGQVYATVWDNEGYLSVSGDISCRNVIPISKKEYKKNFEKLVNAKDILNQVDIYKYNFKDDDKNTKKSIGFVIGNEFNYSQEITSKNNDGVNLYSMVSVLWQVVKEQQEEIQELKEMIKNGKY